MHNRGAQEWDQFGNLSDYGPFAYNGEENVSHSDIEAPLRDDFAAIDGSFGPLFKLDGRKSDKTGSLFIWHTGNWKVQHEFRYEEESIEP